MKILFVATVDPGGKSGHNIATREVIEAFLNDREVELTVIYPEPLNRFDYLDSIESRAVEVNHLRIKNYGSIWYNIKLQFEIIAVFRSAVRRNRPDLVVTRMGNAITLPLIVALDRLPFYVLIRGLSSRDYQKRLKLPGTNLLWNVLLKLYCRVAKQVYVAYEEIYKMAENYRQRGQESPVLFTNAVNPELFPLLDLSTARANLDLSLSVDDFVIGFAGSIKKRHGLDVLLETVKDLSAELTNLKVLIIGEGPELEGLREKARQYGLRERVIFRGFVPHEKVYIYNAAADILYGVIDLEETENPIKCYEYLASARPIITSVKKEFDFVVDQGFGEAIENINVEEVSRAITRLYNVGEAKRKLMGLAGRSYVLENHTWSSLVELIKADFNNN